MMTDNYIDLSSYSYHDINSIQHNFMLWMDITEQKNIIWV